MESPCVPNNEGWEVGITAMSLTDIGAKIFDTSNLVRSIGPFFFMRIRFPNPYFEQSIQQMHRDHVPGIPPEFKLLGNSGLTPNQGMVKFYSQVEAVDNIQVLTLQGHPEFTKSIVEILVEARGKSGVLSPEVVQDATRRADLQNDGIRIGNVIWRVILG